MKIIGTDNLARDEVADVLVCENVNKHYVTDIVDALNNHPEGVINYYWFIAVANDHRLSRGMEDLI